MTATLPRVLLLVGTGLGFASAARAENPIVPAGAKLELLHTRQVKLNSGLTEGPAVAADGTVYFTDMPFGPDDGMILRFDPKTGKVSVFTDRAFKSNGFAFDAAGNLISCDGADGGGRCLRRWDLKTGTSVVLADRYQGEAVQLAERPVYRLEGADLLHRPAIRRHRAARAAAGGCLPARHRRHGRRDHPRCREAQRPDAQPGREDAVCGRPQQRRQPAVAEGPGAEAGAMKVYAFPLDANGLVAGPRKTLVDFGQESGCDGMCVDAAGNVYLTARSLARPGVLVVDPAGKELAFIPTGPANQSGLFEDWKGIPSNVEFGIGDDAHTLYVTIDKGLYRIRLKTRGPHPHGAGK